MPSAVDRLPLPVRQVGAGLVRRYAVATSSGRVAPDYLIIGSKRGGTTTLFQALRGHPDVEPIFPALERMKSPHYFDLEYARGQRWYRSHFASRRRLDRLERERGVRPVTGEASPYYLYHPLAAERIAAGLPATTKLIVLLRDPVERAFSHHWDRCKSWTETLPFAEAIAAEKGRLAGERERILAQPLLHSERYEHYSYVDRGRYAEQLERWFTLIDRHRFIIIRSEDFYAEPAAILGRVTDFLGIRRHAPEAFGKHHGHADRPSRIEPTLRRRLGEAFADDNARLAELLGTPVWWDAAGATALDAPGVVVGGAMVPASLEPVAGRATV